ncbi:MAG: O-antigen polymerase [Pelobacteraceae bacterium]
MIILYWAITTSFGIAGTLGYFEYAPEWLLAELGGIVLVAARTLLGKKPLGDYISPAGLCFVAWILYANAYYLVYTYVSYNPVGFSFEKSTIDLGFFLSFTSVSFFGFLFELFTMNLKRQESPIIKLNFIQYIQPFPYSVVVMVGLLVIGYFGSIAASGAFSMIGKVDRLTLLDATETGKVWLMHYALTGATIYFLYTGGVAKLGKIYNRWLVGLTLASFWICYFMLGNRRGILTVLLAGGIVFTWKNKLRLRHFVVGFSVLLALMLIGIVRQATGSQVDRLGSAIQIINGIGEFYFPHLTLLQAINNKDIPLLGSTFVGWLPNFIGAKFSGDSYLFLAQQFARDVAPTGTEKFMGYAYMPLTEAYINFGVLGALIAPLMIVGAFWVLEKLFGKKSLPLLIVSAMALDINRGEFGAVMMQYTLFILSGLLLMLLAFISNKMRLSATKIR